MLPVDIINNPPTELTNVTVGKCNHIGAVYEYIGANQHKRLVCPGCGLAGGIECCTFKPVDSAAQEGKCIHCNHPAAAVASVTTDWNETTSYYFTIDDAWTAPRESGETVTITLLSNVEAHNTLTVESGNRIIFNGGGYTLRGNLVVDGGYLYITSGTFSSITTNGKTFASLLTSGCCYLFPTTQILGHKFQMPGIDHFHHYV